MIDRIDEELCLGCGNCDVCCPMDVIHLDPPSRKARIRYIDDCMTCYNCELTCPVGAVRVDPARRERVQAWEADADGGQGAVLPGKG
ncbi:MAG: ferredoxin family protein [Actinomycetota bacterium]